MPNYLPPEEEKKRRELYDQGMTDREIAERCYVSRGVIYKWRKRRGLPYNSQYDERKRHNLYRQGLNDYEIAARCGVTQPAIFQWREKMGLPPNRTKSKIDVIGRFFGVDDNEDVADQEFWEKLTG